MQANCAVLAKSAASAAIVEAVHGHSNGNGSLGTTDRNEFVREVLTLIHVRCLPSHMSWRPFIHNTSFPSVFPLIVVLIDRSLVRGSNLGGRNIARVRSVRRHPCLFAVAYLLSACLPSSHSHSPSLPNSRAFYVATRYQCPCIVARCITPALTCIDIRCK
jgi:hypothetical protein